MKTLTISLSLILSLGLFGCGDEESGSTSFNETGSAPGPVTTEPPSDGRPTFGCRGVSSWDGVTEDSGDVFCSEPPSPTRPTPQEPEPVTTEPEPVTPEPAPVPEPVTPEPVTPEPVRPELPSNDPDVIFCRGVSSWDSVTEDSGDVFCDPEPTRPSSREPLIGCAGTVTSQAQVDSVRDCTVLNGSIDFHRSDVTMINLPLLEHITGKVLLEDNDSLTNLLLPALTSIEGVFIFRFNGVTEISLPALKSIGGYVEIIKNHALTDIVLPVLTTTDAFVEIGYNEVLEEISLPSLTTIGRSLYIIDNDAMTDISLPVLTSADYISIGYNDELTDVSIPNLMYLEDDSIGLYLNRYLTNCDLGSYTDQYCP